MVFNEDQYIFRAEDGSVERPYISGTPCSLCDDDYSLCDDNLCATSFGN